MKRSTDNDRTDGAPMNDLWYRDVYNAVSEAIFVHDAETGAILDANNRMLELYGITHDQALRLSIQDLSDGTPPYSQAEAREYMKKALSSGPQMFKWLAKKPDGERFWTEVSLRSSEVLGKTRVLAVVRDITERVDNEEKLRKTEAALRHSEEKILSIFKLSPDSILLTRIEDGMVLDCNDAFVNQSGYSYDEIKGHTTLDLVIWENVQQRAEYLRKLMTIGEVANEKVDVKRRDGQWRNLLFSSKLITIENERVMLSIGKDITEIQEAERVLHQTNRALRLLSECNGAVVHATDELSLLHEVCRIAVESAGYRMAWVGYAERDEAKTVRPVTFAGPGREFLDQVFVSWGDNEYGHGTAGVAIRTRKPAIGRDLPNNPSFSAWTHAFENRDFAAAISVPLIFGSDVYGVLLIYAAEPDAFDKMEVSLLEDLGTNISHGIMSLRAQQERAEALKELERMKNDLEILVAERTRELRVRNDELTSEIEKRRKTTESLRRSEEKYRELVENANSIILRMDNSGRITFFNEFAQNFFGYGEKEILGKCVIGTIVPEKESTGRDLTKLLGDIIRSPDRFSRNENENIKRNGERIWISWTNKIVPGTNGRSMEILSIGNDITELKQAQEAAQAADRMKSAFLATMSHELRTPLNSIIGFTGIIMQELAGPLNPEQRKQMTMVQNSSRHLLALINDVLDISKIEAGQLILSFDWFDLCGSIRKLVDELTPQAAKKGLPVRIGMPESIHIKSDQRRVEQIIMNLLSNAVKFTAEGEITVRVFPEGEHVEISVNDTGSGIKAEDILKLFKPFFQIDSGITRRYEGTGLGLSISKRLSELLEGSIRVESAPGKGSIFTVTLPLRKES